MRISFAWWNTGLSPLGKARATQEEKEIATKMVVHLAEEWGVDCLALGEVTAEDLTDFAKQDKLKDYDHFNGAHKEGRLQFDTGLLYRRKKLRLFDYQVISANLGSSSVKVATRVDFQMPFSKLPLHIFVSHWPSRNYRHQHAAMRHFLGMQLRESVEDIITRYKDPAQIILLGDYNDEPFDSPLSELLLATRDRHLAREKPFLLYNPFWRHIGESSPHIPGNPDEGYAGSYFYNRGDVTKWTTYDQIIFSHAFLGQGEWQLNEKYTLILHPQSYVSAVLGRDTIFDHFPVLSTIERKVTDG